MTVKDAFQSEYVTEFLSSEIKHSEAIHSACSNRGANGFAWYGEKGGPAQAHEFRRATLDREVAGTPYTSERMAKIAADQIASRQRAYAIRYLISPISYVVRAGVRRNQHDLAANTTKDLLEATLV